MFRRWTFRAAAFVLGALFGGLATQPAGAQTVGTPQLVLDAGGHTAAVSKVRFTPDGRGLVTVSNDKAIRAWDATTGEVLGVLRPPIGPGPAGMLYALAISPDARYVAAGGYEQAGTDHGIYVIRAADGGLETVLRGHSNVILDLAFSPDGRTLASASADQTARLWNVSAGQCDAVLRGHRGGVYGVAFDRDGRRVATASLDGTARVWNCRDGSVQATLRGGEAAARTLDWSPDGESLAVGYADQTIRTFAVDGKLTRRYEKLGNHVTTVKFSRNGQELFYTLGGSGATDGGFLIDLQANRGRVAFTQHNDSVLDGALSPDGKLAATADANGEVCVWSTRDGRVAGWLRSPAARPWSVAWHRDGHAIGWGTASRYREPNDRGPLELCFDLQDLDFVGLDERTLQRAVTQTEAARIELVDERNLLVRHFRGQVRLQPAAERDAIRCYTLLSDAAAAVGSDFGLLVYDTLSGKPIRRLEGHSGGVWAAAPSPDGRHLVTAGDDRTLRIWDWKAGRLVVSLFFAGRQWIAWTPEGRYAASPGGERLMGWQVGNDPNQLAQFHPAVRFRQSLYQPDAIRGLLAPGDAVAVAEGQRPNDWAFDGVAELLPPVVRISAPTAEAGIVRVGERSLLVRAVAQSRSGHAVKSLRLLLDGRPYEGRRGLQILPADTAKNAEVSAEWTLELAPGRHLVSVQAETTVSKGVSEAVPVVFEAPATESRPDSAPRLPDLYVLAVGIADYPGTLRLQHAASDADVIAEALTKAGTALFRQVKVKRLTNADADRRGILSGLSWLRKEMTQQDVAVFFYSGHGAKDAAGNFYLVPVDGDPDDLLATGVAGSQFKDALAAIPGRVVALLDACHAGAAPGGDRRKAVHVVTDDLIRDLATDDYGVVVMCSSMGREYSRESAEHEQGYFTLALVESLSGRADYNQDGLVHLTEIDTYVADRVKTLTDGQQHPVTAKPATIRSFPLGKVSS